MGWASSSRIENAARVATTKPAANASAERGRRTGPGYVNQSGATTSVANFVQPAKAAKIPRPHAELASQKPQIRKTGTIESFVFDISTYVVKGNADHASARAPASSGPPKRKPTSAMPSRQRKSNSTDVNFTAGSLSHFPDQPKIPYPGRYAS